MRIGLILSGHVRSFRNTHFSFQQFRKTLEELGTVDLFCQAWDIEESVSAAWWKKEGSTGDGPKKLAEEEWLNYFRPVKYIVSETREFNSKGFAVPAGFQLEGIQSMLFAQQQGNELMKAYAAEKQVQYNLVLKTRYDLLYDLAPSLTDQLRKSVENRFLVLPSSNPYELLGCYSDVLAAGPADLMQSYFSFSERLPEALKVYLEKGYRRFIPELCMTEYLNYIKLPLRELEGLRIHILRKSGEKFTINTGKDFQDNNPHCFNRSVIEANSSTLPENTGIDNKQEKRLVKKYIGWLMADEQDPLSGHAERFYLGQWTGTRVVVRLIKKTKNSNLFKKEVIKDFFEEALRNGKYSQVRKLYLGVLLFIFSRYGFFHLRVWKNQLGS